MKTTNVTLTLSREQVHVLAMAVDIALDSFAEDAVLDGENAHTDTICELEGLEAILSERIRFLAND
jgi:hypothetical protein